MVTHHDDPENGGSRPVPDPTLLTTQQLIREVTVLKQYLESRVENSENVISARIDGMEKAIEVFQADLTRVPTQLDRAIQSHKELNESEIRSLSSDINRMSLALAHRGEDIREQIVHLRDLSFGKIEELASVTTERFQGVAAQFSERDTRTDQRAGDTKLAVDAAFAAAKEATAKIEAGFTKSIDSILELLKTTMKSSDEKISDLKDRITSIESRTVGITSANTETRNTAVDNRGMVFGSIGIAISVVTFLVLAFEVISKSH